ncbi:MAG: DNA-3-methyladenine glycosylase 2 family protein [Chloroflexi bacterium]|nr:DNA-3-methyladenine glycosylase 2 family protein [Chloroflexota bacterium]OJV88723.1 MAG: hypothetical protein BGO39_04260 [Chloroflexi bacterium 54-19]
MTAVTEQSQQKGLLLAEAPFDFSKTLGFLGVFGPTAGEQTYQAASLVKALTLNERAVAFEIRPAGPDQLAYTLYSERPLTGEEQASVEDRLRFFLSLDDQLGPFYTLARRDPIFAGVVKKLYGLHQPKFLTPYELACWAILGQRVPWRVAHKIKMTLVERFGTSIEVAGQLYRAFPEPAQLTGANRDELLAIVQNARKVDYLQAVTDYFLKVDENFLRYGDFEEVAASLLGIKGVGEWSSHFILVRGLGRMQKVSSFDRELIRAVGQLYGLSETAAEARLPELLELFHGYQGYFAFYARVATAGASQSMAQYD